MLVNLRFNQLRRDLNRTAGSHDVPSTSASTFSSRAMCGSGLRARLHGITEVREMTRRAPICPTVAISSSVIPSAKYYCDASLTDFRGAHGKPSDGLHEPGARRRSFTP